MPKAGEVAQIERFFAGIDAEAGTRFMLDKPFSHDDCPRYLVELGRVFTLLPPPPARVLDLGVGMGWTTVFLALRGYHVVGQDICGDAIALARRNAARYGVATAEFAVTDYESMTYRDEFDAALFYDALHHAEDERAALAGVFAALKPGGVCLAVEPGEGHATSGPTLEYVAKYGVTEKDMPPRHVIDVARGVGFRSFRVYSRDLEPTPVLVADLDARPAASRATPFPGRIATSLRFARKALRALLKGTCAEDGQQLFGAPVPKPEPELRESAIIWMRK
ncbi:MAG: class I SAM-dependent methyltransferase [Gemmataceae bacterium]